ncbi:hypothetical protein [Sphingobium ummariense]|uniref:hypothetical protein n=1 Tax=Sphingobium ummariense TaxID=420994 RepID=UPI001268D0C5|nr:hypothetical protein [Sphingobium ummariense]
MSLIALICVLIAVVSGLAASSAKPCGKWGLDDFCSDYGQFYWVLCGLASAGVLIALWAIRKSGKRD